MNIGQVGTKYSLDCLEAYKEGYEKGRADKGAEMIDCKGCPIDSIHESDEERLKCGFRERCEMEYQRGRKDAFDEAIKKVHEYWTAGRIKHSFLEALEEDFELMKEE